MISAAPARLSNADIARYADRIGTAHSLCADGKADISRLVRDLGGNIEYRDGGESLHVREQGDFTIFLPHFTSSARDRFTIAHELGHYFLHYRYAGLEGEATFGRGQRNRMETESNVFASALLMPESQFKEQWIKTDGDSWKVANYFDVSPAAAGVRAEVLQLR